MRNVSPQLIAGGNISPSTFVKLSTSADNTALQAGANDAIIGISQVGTKYSQGLAGLSNTYAAESGDNLELFGFGDITDLVAGSGGYARGDLLASDASGNGVTASAGQNVGAIALESAAAGAAGRVQIVKFKNGGTGSYGAGDGGAVTQATDSTTGVTLNKVTGQITTVALTTAAAAEERFTVTNSQIAATDTVSFGTTYNGAGTPMIGATHVTAGTFDIVITNLHASAALNAAMVINFAIVKGSAS